MSFKKIKHASHLSLEGTGRIEAFSDGVVAIIVTLLVLEIHVPVLSVVTNQAPLDSLHHLLPKLIAFAASFAAVAVFWVNHHHFFHPIEKADPALLWHNNHLLFWMAIIPFVTAFVGDYPSLPLVLALYGFVLFMSALAFNLMGRHVFFHSQLLPESLVMDVRQKQWRRSLVGLVLYGLSVGAAFVHPYLAYLIFVIVPVYYFVPRRYGEGLHEILEK